MDPDDLPVQDSDQLPQDTLADELGESDYDRRRLRAQQRARRMGRAVRSARDMPSDPTEAAEQQEQLHETARAIVLRQLTASAKSRQQLEDKLADKDVPESVARAVLDRFEQVELVDDQAFAQSYVRQRAETRKLARPALRMELQRKGVDRDLVEQALAQRTDDDERADAVELARRKLPSGPALQAQLADREAKHKLIRRMVSALARKGYAPGLAFEVVRGVLDDHGAGDDGLLEEPESL
ncbi:regulatory protein RecX [Kocuria sp. SL71]|uniref:regulatory protein RecX n=1 Tax=Kocuria sp. SL71 TaxID=2995151 RepID=UPI002273061A|nr:regulatory protein RecX [Kocuria sp. SL71]MCY1683928.1 regulatory protein RecX [Kocuria sp. SL71]